MLSAQEAGEGLLLVSSSLDTCSSIVNDTIVEMNCFLHVRGNLLGNLTIEPGAQVIVDGSVGGKINNRGGKLLINHKELAASVDGPAEAEACGVLRINLTAIASNWAKLAKYTEAECAAVVKGNVFCLQHSGSQTRSRSGASFDHLCPQWAVLRDRADLRRNQCATRHQ